jgi:hypothetical protein
MVVRVWVLLGMMMLILAASSMAIPLSILRALFAS